MIVLPIKSNSLINVATLFALNFRRTESSWIKKIFKLSNQTLKNNFIYDFINVLKSPV